MWAVGGDYLQEHHLGPIAGPVRRIYFGLCILLGCASTLDSLLLHFGEYEICHKHQF